MLFLLVFVVNFIFLVSCIQSLFSLLYHALTWDETTLLLIKRETKFNKAKS